MRTCAGSPLALGKIGPEAKDAIPHFVALLKDPDKHVRWAAAGALGEIGSAAKDAVPHLIELLKDLGEDVRWAAARALGEIGSAAKDAVPHLIELLKDPGEDVRWPPPSFGRDRPGCEGRRPSPHRATERPA